MPCVQVTLSRNDLLRMLRYNCETMCYTADAFFKIKLVKSWEIANFENSKNDQHPEFIYASTKRIRGAFDWALYYFITL